MGRIKQDRDLLYTLLTAKAGSKRLLDAIDKSIDSKSFSPQELENIILRNPTVENYWREMAGKPKGYEMRVMEMVVESMGKPIKKYAGYHRKVYREEELLAVG